jgi:4-carboxymuconolactone decarboxylase
LSEPGSKSGSRAEREAQQEGVDPRYTEPATAPETDPRWEAGRAVRRAVLGAEHVERAEREATDFDRDFQRYITRSAWGEAWTRPGLPIQTRHLLTIVMLAALNRQEELEMHLEATRNTGVTPEQVREALLHVAVYAGVPAANAAMKLAKRVLFVGESGR